MQIMVQQDITAVILAGGLGTRLGGVDKGLQLLAGEPLVAHVLRRIAPQAGFVVINCNRNTASYARFGCTLVPDRIEGFPGPLAGLHAALTVATTPLVLTVPCDAPYLPADLAERLAAGLQDGDAAIATTARSEPVFALYRQCVLRRLEVFLAEGGHKVGQWQAELNCIKVDFSDQPEAFRNLNSPDDWPLSY